MTKSNAALAKALGYIASPEALRAINRELERRDPFELQAAQYMPRLKVSPLALLLKPREAFDFKTPDYAFEAARRAAALDLVRANADLLSPLKAYYRDHPAAFIDSWGMTLDPRNIERGLPALIPFVLFPKQVEWIEWLVDHWKRQSPGITEKSRDVGVSWLSMALACTLCLFYRGMSVDRKSTRLNSSHLGI